MPMKYLVSLLLLFNGFVHAQKPRNYSVVTNELTQRIITAPNTTKPMQLAVVPFAATKSSTQVSPQFGEYLTETVIGLIGNQPGKVRLFERTRLDAILKEQEFELSELMKPATALKIGKLAPIDALLSGTYTKLKSYIDVSARLIDVASGEVLVTYSGRVKMDKNLSTLFQERQSSQAVKNESTAAHTPAVNVIINNTNSLDGHTSAGQSHEEICKQKVKEFHAKLNDLSSVDKINAVVNEAIQTGFDTMCGKLHYDVMYTFTRYNIQQEKYHRFLLSTLDTIAYPVNDDRAMEIIRYLAHDKQISEEEWQASFKVITRIGNYWLSNYLSYLLSKPSDTPVAITTKRIDSFFERAASGKIGLPLPIHYEVAYFEMMEALKNSQELRQYLYEHYSQPLVLDDKNKVTFFSELHSMYKEEKQADRKLKIIGWIADFINSNEYTKAHEQLYDFAWQFNLTLNEERNKEIRSEFSEHDLQTLIEKTKNRFSVYAMNTPYPSQQEDRINFCVKYGIPVTGVIPTLEEAEQILKGTDVNEQLRVMKLLVLMGDKPKKVESALVTLIGRKSLEDRDKLTQAQTLTITVFGNCKTSNSKAIDFMIESLPHYGNDTEAAKIALVQIGKPAVPALISRLDKTTIHEGGLQYQLISMLGKIGKDASPSVHSIQRVLDSSGNNDVKYAAEAALQAIK